MGEESSLVDRWDDIFPKAKEQRAAMEEKGLIFSQHFLVFARDPAAKAVLAFWTQAVRRKTLSPAATVQEYAAHNAVREFVEGIHAHIEFANQGVNTPKPRTS